MLNQEFDSQLGTTSTVFDPAVAFPGDPSNFKQNIFGEALSHAPQAMPIDGLVDFPLDNRSDLVGAIEVEDDLNAASNSTALGSNSVWKDSLNAATEASHGLITQGIDWVDHAVETSADFTKGTVQNVSESMHSAIDTLAERWNDPNNSIHNALNQQVARTLTQVGRLATRIGHSQMMDRVRQHVDAATEWTSALTETVSDSLGYSQSLTDMSQETATLDAAVAKVQAELIDFSQDPEMIDKLEIAFGDDWSPAQAKTLFDTLVQGEGIPKIRVIPDEVLKADGGFGNGQILLSRRLVAENRHNLDKIAEVIIEEWGHSFDQQLNPTDSPGDEGDIFTRQVRGETISAAELQALKQENDHATLRLDGQEIAIEQAVNQIYDDTPATSTASTTTPVSGSDRRFYIQAGKEDRFDAALAAQQKPSTEGAVASPQWLRYTPGSVQSGDRVRQWQRRMHLLGFDIEIDGHFGPGSERVARQFQQSKGLEVDGIVGPRTWKASFAETVTHKGPRTPDAIEAWNKPKPENPRQADLLSQEVGESSESSVKRSIHRRKKPENPRQADLLSEELGEISEPTSDNSVVDWIVDNQKTINRGLGVVQTVDGVFEIVGGVGGILFPEPATSVAGVAIALHGIDTTIAGARTVWTGESQMLCSNVKLQRTVSVHSQGQTVVDA